ncbi:NUDIX domain-containing protein [Phototrophicus methaneseepsis]|uniref:NUDIX domain-containing protein n=1 Tax=Phototrophicus methaneseepsis TaxID=2710758 RepID=A0A7S8ECF1_9CHLR|nr:NUDIX domain-containing protein [Phototrophicus methaneseepsis]QPC84427.1 NUDIX domain-containing protein [Phototrophicus methaneseepsis]
MGKKQRIRTLALAHMRQGEHIFVGENIAPSTGRVFYRPIGGGVEFGEHARDALIREIDEEIGVAIRDVRFACVLENIFAYEGAAGHEICLMFACAFTEAAHRALDYRVQGTDDGDVLYIGRWMPIAYFVEGGAPLYPDGYLDYLLKQQVNFD